MLIKKPSPIHGKGVFTTEPIKKGKAFYEVPVHNTSTQPQQRWAHIGEKKWVEDEDVLNYVNHSCNSNTTLSTEKPVSLIANRNIAAGEEITVDYDKTEHGGEPTPCSCSSKNCRGEFLRIT